MTKFLSFLNAISTVFSIAGWVDALLAMEASRRRGDAIEKGLDSQGAELSNIYTQLGVMQSRVKKQDARLSLLERDLDSMNSDFIDLRDRYTELSNKVTQAESNSSKAIVRLNNIEREPKIRILNDKTAQAVSNSSKAIVRLDRINEEPKIRELNDKTAQAVSNSSKAIVRLDKINEEPKIRDLNDKTAQAVSNSSKAIVRLDHIDNEPKIRDLTNGLAKITSDSPRVSSLDTRLRTVEELLKKTLDDSKSTSPRVADEIKREIIDIKRDIDSLKKSLTGEKGLSRIDARMKELERTIQSIKTSPDTLTKTSFYQAKQGIDERINSVEKSQQELGYRFITFTVPKPGTPVANPPGPPGKDGKDGKNGKDGKSVDPRDVLDIKNLLRDLQGKMWPIPAIIPAIPGLIEGVNNTVRNLPNQESFKNAVSEGVCNTAGPKGCVGSQLKGLNNGVGGNGEKLDELNAALNALDLAGNALLNDKMDDALRRLGPQAEGGLSGKLAKGFKWLGADRVINIFNLFVSVHNAYMVSSNLSQTLFFAVDNVLQVFGVNLKDSEGHDSNFGQLISSGIDSWFKSIFGVSTWEGIKEKWKVYNRIYQSAANMANSVRSIGSSILSGLEVVGANNAKIGNALKRAGTVMENAFGWMNTSPNFQNRFFTAVEKLENVVSSIDNVTGEVLNIQQEVTQIQDSRKEMLEAIAEVEGSKQGSGAPEAQKTKEVESKGKEGSKGTTISDSDLIKPQE